MSTKYAIVGGKLIDGTGAEPVENSLVLVDDNGKIEYAGVMQDLPEGVEVIDAAGKTVLPGLIDTHLHFSGNLTDDDTDWVMQPLLEKQAVAVKQAYDCLTHGLTTVCEIGRFGIQIRDCIDKGVFKGPRVLATGLGFCRVAGHGDSHHCTQELNKESHPWGDQVDGPWDLRKAVRRRLRENPDAIKIWATGGGIWRWDSGRDQHYCCRLEIAHPAFDVQEFLRAQISAEARLRDCIIRQFQSHPRRGQTVAAMCDIGKRTAMNDGRNVFQRLHQVRFDRLFQ